MSTPCAVRLSRDSGAEVVVAEAADVARAPAEPRAGGHRGGDLTAGQPGEALQPLLACSATGYSATTATRSTLLRPKPATSKRCVPGLGIETESARARFYSGRRPIGDCVNRRVGESGPRSDDDDQRERRRCPRTAAALNADRDATGRPTVSITVVRASARRGSTVARGRHRRRREPSRRRASTDLAGYAARTRRAALSPRSRRSRPQPP